MAESIHSSDTLTLKYLLESQSLLNNQPPLCEETNPDKAEKCDDFNQDVWVGPNGVSADMAAAFLGPTLWDRTLPYNDLKLEYMDMNKFLLENGIPNFSDAELTENINSSPPRMEESPQLNQRDQISPFQLTDASQVNLNDSNDATANSFQPVEDTSAVNGSSSSPSTSQSPLNVDVNFEPVATEIALATVPGQQTFDPKTANFNDDELKPQPMIKKSKKIIVPDEQKDDKYWEKRKKNNTAAKRSRDARRIKENQIAIRAGYLQKESNAYKSEIQKLKKENANLKKLVEKYERQMKLFNTQ
ncbi:thyrotroph embryonic factor-like [Antedon mediterranea]|uniref:thyrotroph embryonic factor-like n=1 Tax=Antedon mediterranea TaxID=105859 RepID=UPI003AF4A433